MKKVTLILIMLASSGAYAATNDDANSALMENISRFQQYEQSAQQMAQGRSSVAPVQHSQIVAPVSQTEAQPAPSASAPQTNPANANSSVYDSIKILIESGNLTDKQKIKLISKLSA